MGLSFGSRDRKAAEMWRERQRENMKRREEENADLGRYMNRAAPTENFIGRKVDDANQQ